MKKTKKTLLTAAAFAAAMNMATASNVNAVTSSDAEAAAKKTYDPSTEIFQAVYGPGPDYEFPTTTTQPVTTDNWITSTFDVNTMVPLYGPPPDHDFYTGTYFTETTTVTTTTTEPEVLYGPPWVFPGYTGTIPPEYTQDVTSTIVTQTLYGPPAAYYYEKGDANGDGVVDVFDVIAFRKRLLSSMGRYASIADKPYDLNNDGEVGISDLVSLQNFILGRTPYFEDVTTMIPQPEYGPELDIQQPAYGPPPDLEDTSNTTTSATTKKTRTTYKKTTTTTTTTSSVSEEPIYTLDPEDMPVQLMYGPPEYFGLDPDTLQPKE